MHINCASLSPCSYTTVVISNIGVSPSGDLTIDRVFLYIINMKFMISVGIPYIINISFIFSRFIKSKAGRFLDFTPSSMLNS